MNVEECNDLTTEHESVYTGRGRDEDQDAHY